jgi:hypothetical protein
MSTDKLAEKIPDIYFDWYARFLPGAVAVIYFLYYNPDKVHVEVTYVAVYGFLAYMIGHIVQPASELVIKFFQKIIGTNEDLYAKSKKDPALINGCLKASKAFAESVGFFSACLAIICCCVYFEIKDMLSIIFIVYFFAASIERSYSRKRKIQDLT